MQAETIDTHNGTATLPEDRQDFFARPRTREMTALDQRTAAFWRLVPVLFGLAAWLPQSWASLRALSRMSFAGGFAPIKGGFIQSKIAQFLGPDGLTVAGALLSGLLAFSVWMLARAIGAPRWAAALAASLMVIAPLFGLAPSPMLSIDDAAFGAFATLAIAAVVWAARHENSNFLMAAFIVAIVAAVLRPGAAWPAIAVGLGALLATNKLEEGPLLGMFASLCWAPGLYFANRILSDEDVSPQDFLEGAVNSALPTATSVAAPVITPSTDFMGVSVPAILGTLLSALPFVIFGLMALIGLGVAFLLGKGRRRGAIAGAVGAVVSVIGAIGYGSVDAARWLLDPVFLGLAAALGLILPALIREFRNARERSNAQTAQASVTGS